VSQFHTERLTTLGLTSYEAKAYLALIRRDSSTAAEVARLAAVPRQRVYDVLASLAEKGLASARAGNPVKYTAQDPEEAIRRLIETRREQLELLEDEAEELVAALTPAYREGLSQTDPLEYIDVLRDERVIRRRFDELQASVEREILVFTKPPYATPLEENVEGLKLLGTKTARAVYEYSLFDDPAAVETVGRFVEAGEQARFVPHLPLKLAIVDESIVLFGMQDPLAGESELTIVVVEHPSLAHLLKLAFVSVWESGLTFEQARELLAPRLGARSGDG
jgi:sugar-specific transcriptional regulator TrmB